MKNFCDTDEFRSNKITPPDGPRESGQEYRSLVENAPDAICVHTDGTIVYANKAMFELLRAKKPEDLIGTTVAQHVHPSLRKLVSDRITTVQEGVEQERIEEVLIRVDGTLVNVDVISIAVTYYGRPSVQSILRDITEQKRAREALRESEALFRSQFEFGNIGIALTDLDKRWRRVNKRLCDMLGYSESQLLQKTWTEMTHPDDLDIDLQQFNQMLAGEIEAYEIDKRFIRKNAAIIYTHLTVSCFRNQDHSVRFVIASLQDITEHKRAEEALKESEKRLRFLLDNAPVAIAVTSPDGQIEAFNDRFLQIMKAPSAEAAFAYNSRNAYAGDDERLRLIEALKEQGLVSDYETVLRCIDGSYAEVSMTMKLITVSGKQSLLTVFLDITEPRRAAEALRVSEEIQRALMNASPDVMFITDAKGILLAMNEATAKRFGAPMHDLLGSNIYLLLPPDVADQREKHIEQVRRSGKPAHFQDERKGMWLENAIFPVLDGTGKVAMLAVYSRDITERRQREEALRLTEFSIEHSGVSTIWFDRQGRVMRANEAASTSLGYTREELLKMTVQNVDPNFRLREKWDAAWEWIKSHGGYATFESHHRHKSGKVFPVQVVNSFFDYAGQEYVFSFVQDITERKEAEEQLQRALLDLEHSNNELAQFAYVASHDLQEPLRMVASFVELLAKRYQGQLDERADSYISYAVEGASRMQSLIQGLLSYSGIHTHGKEFEIVNCEEVMQEVLSNLRRMTTEKDATVHCGPLPVVKADRTQMIQLFQNLLINAMTFHGTESCIVEVGVRKGKEEYIFSVKDNGIGIEPQYYERIFAIFQRLNPRNTYPGTGIGLSICKRIVERHGGRIWVESQPEKGSTLFFTIPDGGKP